MTPSDPTELPARSREMHAEFPSPPIHKVEHFEPRMSTSGLGDDGIGRFEAMECEKAIPRSLERQGPRSYLLSKPEEVLDSNVIATEILAAWHP